MHTPKRSLGSLIQVHGTSSALLQRAAIVAFLSFLFFMTTLMVFYIQQQIMYFILASAFLVIYFFTMAGWVMQKRNVVSLHENGITYKKFAATWGEIKSVNSTANAGIRIVKNDGEAVWIGKNVSDVGAIAAMIRRSLPE